MAISGYSENNPPPDLVEEIRSRLGRVCEAWPRSLFDRVTARAAWLEFKYRRTMMSNMFDLTPRDFPQSMRKR